MFINLNSNSITLSAEMKHRATALDVERLRERVRLMYIATCGMCAMMVSWILVLPGSALIGALGAHHRQAIEGVMMNQTLVPPSLIFKYQMHPAVKYTHILPAALWSLLIPFQLHPRSRTHYRRLHRAGGRCLMVCSALLMGGYLLIHQRCLHYDLNDFPEVSPQAPPSLLLPAGCAPASLTPLLHAVAAWFTATGVLSVRNARARRFVAHRSWTLRHIAAGLWVALQRMFIPVILHGSAISTGSLDTVFAPEPWRQKAAFGDAGIVAIAVAIGAAEWAVHAHRILDLPEPNVHVTGEHGKLS